MIKVFEQVLPNGETVGARVEIQNFPQLTPEQNRELTEALGNYQLKLAMAACIEGDQGISVHRTQMFEMTTDKGNFFMWDAGRANELMMEYVSGGNDIVSDSAFKDYIYERMLTIDTSCLAANLPNIEVDPVYAMTTDISMPVLLVNDPFYPENHMLIDGWHRVAKASMLGKAEMVGYVLPPQEELECRVYTCQCKPFVPGVALL